MGQKNKNLSLNDFFRFMKWTLIKRIKKIRPLWYLEYSKEEARKVLQDNYNWRYYGGHHMENRLAAFYHAIYMPQKFNRILEIYLYLQKLEQGS